MRVLVIENAELAPVGLFGDWLREQGAVLTIVASDALPDNYDGFDLIVSLGSPHGAYEPLPWIARQRDFLAGAVAADRAVIGICFGAQLLADAIGGRAAKLPDGQRFIGWHSNAEVTDPLWSGPWLRFHQDHLVVPDAVEVLARDQGTVQAFHYGRAVGVQFHPEAGHDQVDTWASLLPDWLAAAGLTQAGFVAASHSIIDDQRATRDRLFREMLRRTVGA